MKNKYHAVIRERLKQYRNEAKECIWSGNYAWHPYNRAVELLNKILKGIPADAWPKHINSENYPQHVIRNGSWKIRLFWGYDNDGKRHADLVYDHDDHTAWVREHRTKKGTFVNHDIGGS